MPSFCREVKTLSNRKILALHTDDRYESTKIDATFQWEHDERRKTDKNRDEEEERRAREVVWFSYPIKTYSLANKFVEIISNPRFCICFFHRLIILYWRTVLDTKHAMWMCVYLFCTDFSVCQHFVTFKYPYHGWINIMPVIYIFKRFCSHSSADMCLSLLMLLGYGLSFDCE